MGGWLLVYVIWTAIYLATAMFMVYMIQMPSQASLDQLRAVPGGGRVADIIYRLSWGYICVSWAWYLLYGWVLWKLVQLRQGLVKPVKFMIIATPIFDTLLPLAAAAVVTTQIEGADFWSAALGAYGAPVIIWLIIDYLNALVWFSYYTFSVRVKNTWPNG